MSKDKGSPPGGLAGLRKVIDETDAEIVRLIAKRLTIVGDIERYAMDEMAYQYPVLWWYRIVPYLNVVRGWKIGSNHYYNQQLETVWLAQ